MTTARVERRLAAILAADVVGYSRLMGKDEAGTLARLKAHRKELIEPLVAEHCGRIVKLTGDGVLCEFASVVDAVACAVAIQQGIADRELDVHEAERIRFRIGVNLGDVIVEGEDIYGDGVNIAARLEGLAGPEGICLSEDAYRQVKGKIKGDFVDLGRRELKNIAEPVRVYRTNLGIGTDPSATFLPQHHDKISIAVLPFTNMSRDPEQDYFSDGITEDIITELSRFRSLLVVARNSSFRYKNQVPTVQDVGRQLGVEYVVEGSVRKAGGRVRITAQLVRAETGHQVWAERYDRDMEDLFEVQDDVVRRVTATLVGRLEDARRALSQRRPKGDLRAYDIYLRARQHFVSLSPDDNRKAVELLEAAIGIEPDLAAALALLSEVHLRAWLHGWSDDPASSLAEARRTALRAIELDEEDSRTHTALGLAYLFTGERDRSRRHFEAALRLNPNDPRVLVFYSRFAAFNGDPNLALELADRAIQLNPFGKYNLNLGIAKFAAGRYDEAVDQLGSVRDPPLNVLAILAASFVMLDRVDEARAISARLLAAAQAVPALRGLAGEADWREFFAARWPFGDPEELARFLAALRKAGLPL
jgi:adenylate cyclase